MLRVIAPVEGRLLRPADLRETPAQLVESEDRADVSEPSPRTIREAREKDYAGGKMKEM
jgi:hypothetical protein